MLKQQLVTTGTPSVAGPPLCGTLRAYFSSSRNARHGKCVRFGGINFLPC